MTSRRAVALKADGYMDLNVDILERTNECVLIALSHYYKHDSGDMIADPDMEVKLYPSRGMAEAMTYQDGFGYRQVYHDPDLDTGKFRKVDPRAKKELNSFLNQWISNLLQQGHKPETGQPDNIDPPEPD